MLKTLLNLPEQLTHTKLHEICERYHAIAYPKVRLADILPIENSGVSHREYRFSLQSHVDFVVCNDECEPLFGVEFDGPLHASTVQAARDEIKDLLCQRFDFPLLRITSMFLTEKHRNMDLLTWLVEVWFLQEGWYDAQDRGDIPEDEPFAPFLVLSAEGHEENCPFWLAAEAQMQIEHLHKEGRCFDWAPSHIIGFDAQGNYKAIGWLRMAEDRAVVATVRMRGQHFGVLLSDLLAELIALAVHRNSVEYLTGRNRGVLMRNVAAGIAKFRQQHTMCTAAYCGNPLGTDETA